jgi:hypothetical protein
LASTLDGRHGRVCTKRRALRCRSPSLRPELGGKPASRKAGKLSCVRFGSACYSVPSKLIGATVLITVDGSTIRILEPFTGEVAAEHQLVSPPLTARHVWAQFIQSSTMGSGGTAIPSTVTAQLGLFTMPVGLSSECMGTECSNLTVQNGTAYKALNQLAYGYSWTSTCASSNPLSTVPPAPCTEWMFFDANTGDMIVWMWQPQPGTP